MNTTQALSAQLYAETTIGQNFPNVRPLISHYCSTATLEAILRQEQIWLSNPLLMNDLEELRFGMLIGRERIRNHEGLRDLLGPRQQYDTFKNFIEDFLDGFANEWAFDVYIACFAEHTATDVDGLLSMWRGYGANGNGACIVFDTSKLNEVPESPLIIGKIEYANRDTRIHWIDSIINVFCKLIPQISWSHHDLKYSAWVLFERLLVFSLYTKHHGFREEQEWRLTYMKHRDSQNLLGNMLDYHIGPRGIEPKLKLKIKPLKGATDSLTFLDNLVHSIILGPTTSADIHRRSVERMLKHIGREALISKLISSSIPFRSN